MKWAAAYRILFGVGFAMYIASWPMATAWAAPAIQCEVTYTIKDQWSWGFVAELVVKNTGTAPIEGYTVSWSFANDAEFHSGWDAEFSQTNQTISASNSPASWNGVIAANGGTVEFGFLGQHNGTVGGSYFRLNGVACNDASEFILIDQFGYLPDSEKVAVIRDPQVGFDADKTFVPGGTYALVDSRTGERVWSGTPVAWNGGATDPSSGDRAWWFTFSEWTEPGDYFILDVDRNLRSYEFRIAPDVYNEVLVQAVRAFYYQRAGFDKDAQYAGVGWADTASHLGPLQDTMCRRWSQREDASTELDLRGGWYDAGDFNKYTNWMAGYVIALLRAYERSPSAFSDDTNLPESGNGLPDVIDETKYGMDFLMRMQRDDGSSLSIVGMSGASPPSAATGQSVYGDANTSATLSSAGAFAYGAKIFGSLGMTDYAEDLTNRAIAAWNWADANPNVIFRNNDSQAGTKGLGAGQQETGDYGRLIKKLAAACYLFEITGDTQYRDYFDANFDQVHLVQWWFAYPFEEGPQELLLYYTKIPGATQATIDVILQRYQVAMEREFNFANLDAESDPYLAYMKDYTWGSNATKSSKGNMFMASITYDVNVNRNADARRAAQRYIHYLHGVNPLGQVYLSNMSAFGAEKSVNEFFHTWFKNGSPQWDRVGTSVYGPPPGFLTGGPNPSYNVDGCCPNSCGSDYNNSLCAAESVLPPKGQPAQKSYKDFNTGWPLNSWSVTENSNGYQAGYIRLLSHFAQ